MGVMEYLFFSSIHQLEPLNFLVKIKIYILKMQWDI